MAPPPLRGGSAVSEIRDPRPSGRAVPRGAASAAPVPFPIVWWRRASRPPGPPWSRGGRADWRAPVVVPRGGRPASGHGYATRRPGGAAAGAGRAREGHLVDALASRGDEGRGTLRKAPGSREQASIRGSPNGATHPSDGVPPRESIAWRGEPGELKHLSTRRKGHQPRLRQ